MTTWEGDDSKSALKIHLCTNRIRQTVPAWIGALELSQDFDATILDDLQAELRWVRLAAGDILFREGDPGDVLYVLTRGHLAVTIKDVDGTPQKSTSSTLV